MLGDLITWRHVTRFLFDDGGSFWFSSFGFYLFIILLIFFLFGDKDGIQIFYLFILLCFDF